MSNLAPALLRAIEREATSVPFRVLQTRVIEMMTAYRSGDPSAAPRLDETGAKAYAAYRMPATVAALVRVFSEISVTTGLEPTSLVDLGGGTGAGIWAAHTVWPSLAWATVVDRSPEAVDVGKRLTAELDIAVTWITEPASGDLPAADVAVAAYLMSELTAAEVDDVVDAMTATAETAVVVEPGTPVGYERILTVRDRMLDAGMALAAPCPHHRECPLAGRDWCHFAARFNRPPWLRRLKDAELGHEDEKYSYVVGTRLDVTATGDCVIRHPQKRDRMVTLELCRSDGAAETVTISRRHGDVYKQARDVRWGDRWLPHTRQDSADLGR